MLTFEGKAASFVPGREVPNKEPPVSKFVVEKLYKVHRERLRDMQPVVDCHVEIPDFLTNMSWKKITEEHRREVIRMHNEEIYQRIAKVENTESQITSDNRKHIKHVENELKLMKNLKEKGRVRNILKIQRENEDLLQRIERARPEYTRKAIKEWYKHHELFKKGRRSDPTAGHLGFKSLKGLLPKAIPRGPPSNLDLAIDAASSSVVNGDGGGPASAVSSSSSAAARHHSRPRASTARTPLSRSADGGMMSVREASILGGGGAEAFPFTKPHTASPLSPHKGAHHHHHHDSSRHSTSSRQQSTGTSSILTRPNSAARMNDLDNRKRPGSARSTRSNQSDENGDNVLSPGREDEKEEEEQEGFHVLLFRPFSIPFESKNCVVYIMACRREYDENLYLRVVTNSTPMELHSERPVPIDVAHEIVNNSSTSSLMYSANNDDLMSLRELLVQMFKEADDDGNGYLTFDEFDALMGKLELGISSNELRYVIQEADDNDNGVVDYDEYVPLAVDLIQSFRARNKAKVFCMQRDSMIEDEVVAKMKTLDFENMTQHCIDKIQEYDPKKFGMLRLSDLKKALIAVSFSVGLTDVEIQMICNKLPVDQFGRCLYNSIGEALQKVRFSTLKLDIVESQASDLHHHLLEACRAEERQLRIEGPSSDEQGLTGELPFASLVKVLQAFPKLSLSRLQILVIMAESGVDATNINYQHFLPIVAKSIEFMFEPRALRQRAELINNTEITAETLSRSMFASGAEFEDRLLALYKACDIDSSNGLDEDEFVHCLQSLELELTGNEISAYYNLLHSEANGGVSFEDFKEFFTKNIVEMERVKHKRILQSRLHQTKDGNPQSQAELQEQRKELMEHLQSLFESLDTSGTGFIEIHELEDVIKGLDIDLTAFQLDTIFSEVETDGHGFVDFHNFLPVCADLLQAFIVRHSVEEEHIKHEQQAELKAKRIVSSQASELKKISKRLYLKILGIDATAKTDAEKLDHVQRFLRMPHSGLTRSEANYVTSRLFDTKLHVHANLDGTLSLDEDAPKHEENDAQSLASPDQSADSHDGRPKSGSKLIFRDDGSLHTEEGGSGSQAEFSLRSMKHKLGAFNISRHGSKSMVVKGSSSSGSPDGSTHGSHKSSGAASPPPALKRAVTVKAVIVKDGKILLNANAVKKKSTRILKDLKQDAFEELISEARCKSIMRGLIHEMDKSAVHDFIMHSLEHKRAQLIHEGKCDAMSIYLPTRVCYQMLEETPQLRLSHSQIIAIVNSTEAFDKTGMNVDYKRFAVNASAIIERLFDPHHQLTRANVLDIAKSTVDDGTVMNGLSHEDCNFYLEAAFSELQSPAGTVDHIEFLSVIKDVPLLRLHEKDAITIYAAAEHTHDERVHWRPAVEWIYDSLLSLLREKYIERRMALLRASMEAAEQGSKKAVKVLSVAEQEALQSLRSLAEKLIDFVKVRMDAGVVRAFLPTDKDMYDLADAVNAAADKGEADEGAETLEGGNVVLVDIANYRIPVVGRATVRRGGMLTSKEETASTKFGSLSASASNLASTSSDSADNSGGSAGAPFTPAASGGTGGALRRNTSMQNAVVPSGKAAALVSDLTGHLRIVAQEAREQSVDKELSITFVADGPNGVVTCSLPHCLKLPSMCVVDREIALEFAASIAAKLVVEMNNPMSLVHNLAVR